MSGKAEMSPMGEAVNYVFVLFSMFFLWAVEFCNGGPTKSTH